ncbi:MAG: hypothetical protein ACTSR2_12520 [Candidatus Hodarchaeales archaeon]
MSSSVNEKEVSGQNESSKEILLIAILTVIFFTASAYGVQRTILSTFTEETTLFQVLGFLNRSQVYYLEK